MEIRPEEEEEKGEESKRRGRKEREYDGDRNTELKGGYWETNAKWRSAGRVHVKTKKETDNVENKEMHDFWGENQGKNKKKLTTKRKQTQIYR